MVHKNEAKVAKASRKNLLVEKDNLPSPFRTKVSFPFARLLPCFFRFPTQLTATTFQTGLFSTREGPKTFSSPLAAVEHGARCHYTT